MKIKEAIELKRRKNAIQAPGVTNVSHYRDLLLSGYFTLLLVQIIPSLILNY